MVDLTSTSDVVARPGDKPKGSAWVVYSRLLAYTWHYKTGLMISLFLALVIAASFGAMLVGIGSVVELTFYNPDSVLNGDNEIDPAIKMAARIASVAGTLRDTVGWAPEDLETAFLEMVAAMRENKLQALAVACALVVALAFLIGVARFAQEYLAGAIGANISTDLGIAMYENIIRQPLAFFEARSSGDIIGRFTNDVFMVNRGLAGVFVKLLREPFKAIMFLAIAISIDPWLTLVGICVLPPLAYALTRLGNKVRKSTRRSLREIASMASVVNETTGGMAIVKGFNMEDYVIGRLRHEVGKLRRFLKKMVKADAATGPISEFILVLGVVAFVLFSGQRVEAGRLSAGDLTKLYFALAMMLDPVRKLSSVNNMIQISVASAERVFELIDLRPNIVEAPDAVVVPRLQERLTLERVHFSYDGKNEVLRGVGFEVKRGEMVALVGFSGAGKSTLVKLIPRFYDVTGGTIKIDGLDIRKATFDSLREQISIVTQDTILFAESVRANISFGRPYPEEQVRAAAQAAYAEEFIEKIPGGYDAVIGQGGCTLSGGQRQRLAIARAIIKDPAILILDEATSSLDSESERYIQEALNRFASGRTVVVIAHRLSTVQRADRIVVIDDGLVVQEGTHRQLLDQGGIYRRLYETQFGARET